LTLRSIVLYSVLTSASFFVAKADVKDGSEESGGSDNAIIGKYLAATNLQPASSSMEVEIHASVPQLKQQGRLRALRKISNVGKITYRILGFQGDNNVKKEVIARYLQAEQQSQSDPAVLLTPANYKFKLKSRQTQNGLDSYVFQVSPRKKRTGLFKGELWLDSRSYLPVLEKGRLVKNPSILFKKVEFERAFFIQNGVSVPAHMTSTIDTRIVGKVELDIHYTAVGEGDDTGSADVDTPILTSRVAPL
jgi:hypothetical protein